MFKACISAGFYGTGAGAALYLLNNKLPHQAYIINMPFWMTIVFPLGTIWKRSFLNKINKGEFPDDMKSYKQLFLTSRKAIVYDFVLNQIVYHSALGFILILASYAARKLYDRETQAKNLGSILKNISIGFLKLRMLFTSVSYLTEFWGAKLLLEKHNSSYTISPHNRRILLLKESLIHTAWMSTIINLVHQEYPTNSPTIY